MGRVGTCDSPDPGGALTERVEPCDSPDPGGALTERVGSCDSPSPGGAYEFQQASDCETIDTCIFTSSDC